MQNYKEINMEVIKRNTELNLKLARMRDENNGLNLALVQERERYAIFKRHVQDVIQSNSANLSRLVNVIISDHGDTHQSSGRTTDHRHTSIVAARVDELPRSSSHAPDIEPTPSEIGGNHQPSSEETPEIARNLRTSASLLRQPRHVRSLSPLATSEDEECEDASENTDNPDADATDRSHIDDETEHSDAVAENEANGERNDDDDDDEQQSIEMQLFTIEEEDAVANRTLTPDRSITMLAPVDNTEDDDDDDDDDATANSERNDQPTNDDDAHQISFIRKLLAGQSRQTADQQSHNAGTTLRSCEPTILRSPSPDSYGPSGSASSTSTPPARFTTPPSTGPTPPTPPMRSASATAASFSDETTTGANSTSVYNASITLLPAPTEDDFTCGAVHRRTTRTIRDSTIVRRATGNVTERHAAIATPPSASATYRRHSQNASLIDDSMMSMLSAAVSSTPRLQKSAQKPMRAAKAAALRASRNGGAVRAGVSAIRRGGAAIDDGCADAESDDATAATADGDEWAAYSRRYNIKELHVRISPLRSLDGASEPSSNASTSVASISALSSSSMGGHNTARTRSRTRLKRACADADRSERLSTVSTATASPATRPSRPRRQAAPIRLVDGNRKQKMRNESAGCKK